jgi:ElaB/YqjD/DUF883 family membrane-anchored ribosome-binding protein
MPATAAKLKKQVIDPSSEFMASLPERVADLAQTFDEKVHATRQALDERMKETRRTLKHVRESAEQMSEDAIHIIKKHPIRAVAITFGAGAIVGLAAGLLLRPRRTRIGRLFA